MSGAGGTRGGAAEFWLGLGMMVVGFYLLFSAITVSSSFGLGYALYGFSAFGRPWSIATGFVLIPFIIGVLIVFYNAKNPLGWVLAVGALLALIVGVIASINFSLRSMNSFELIVILVLAFGGMGIIAKSLRTGG